MADGILIGIATNILSKLGSQAVQEITQLWNVGNELNKLQKTVSTIEAVLVDAEEVRQPSAQFKHWLGELRQVLYDAEEVVDNFATEALRRQTMKGGFLQEEVTLFFSRSNQLVFSYKMVSKIREVREALDDVTKDRQNFHFSVHSAKPSVVVERDLSKQGNVIEFSQENFVGRDQDKQNIIALLKSKSDENKVIPIVGVGGLGKTTLAKSIFDDKHVQEYFELRMWVFAGDVEFSVNEIVEKAQKSAMLYGKDCTEENFSEFIRKKNFLLVLDDIWSEKGEKWTLLENNLWRYSVRKSRVIVTTRSLIVAQMTKNPKPYNLECLSFRDSWSLFVTIALEGKEPEKEDVKKNGEEIVRKCGGLPLAIKTIGYTLHLQTKWLPYVNKELSKYPQDENDIFCVLRLSYDHLPSPIKSCFTYCRIFPKGYRMKVQTLVQLWIAQGYVRTSDMENVSLEDVGLEYCKILAGRSFFQEVEVHEMSGNLESFKMHDLMHDLASSIAGDEIVRSNSKGKDITLYSRHLSCDLYDQTIQPLLDLRRPFPYSLLESSLRAIKLRSFVLSIGDNHNYITTEDCDKICKNLTSLLVLDLSTFDLRPRNNNRSPWIGNATSIPKSIGRLKHLRYLDLSFMISMDKLPKSVTNLCNLQVLKLRECKELKELPKDIQKLVSLRYLDCQDCWKLSYIPRGIGELTSLHTLTVFVASPDGSKHKAEAASLHQLGQLNLTGELKIKNLRTVNTEGANLKAKGHLLTLCLEWNGGVNHTSVDRDEDALHHLEPHPNLKELRISNYGGVNFPCWFVGLIHLVDLRLGKCRKCQYLPPLQQLRSLKSLGIWWCDDLEYIDGTTGGIIQLGSAFLPSLKKLSLERCPKLKGWWKVEEGTQLVGLPQFVCLSSLWIMECPRLTCMPLFPNLDDELWLIDASIEPLHYTLNASSSSSSLVPPLSKLKKLWVVDMDLTSLPQHWMQHHLTSLQYFYLQRCPHMMERCGNKNASDWHKIYHIPNIEIDGESIQIDGRYQLD